MYENPEILALRFEGLTYAEIGKRMGISRQRVQQLMRPPAKIAQEVVKKAKGRCEHCGIHLPEGRAHIHHKENGGGYNGIENLELLCFSCHKQLHPHPLQKPLTACLICGSLKKAKRKFCSWKCYRESCRLANESRHIAVVCAQCKKSFKITKTHFNSHTLAKGYSIPPRFFCGRRCLGKWAAAKGGFGVHPENQRLGVKGLRGPCLASRKWDWDMVWAKHIETGFGALRLSRELDIPQSTVSRILKKLRDRTEIKVTSSN